MTTIEIATAAGIDPFDVKRALTAGGALRVFNEAGVLAAADVHVAVRLGRLCGLDPGGADVLLAAALAVRAPRLGHVCTDLATVSRNVILDGDIPLDVSGLPWPQVDRWVDEVRASPLVAGAGTRPLILGGTRLYLNRYWNDEQQVARDLLTRAASPALDVEDGLLTDGLARLFPTTTDEGAQSGDGGDQRRAASTAVQRRLTVIAGGPGTGKTTTIARLLALLHEQAAATGTASPLIALAAPTGKAAARLEEAVHAEAATLDIHDDVRQRLLATSASTLHRLLGRRPDSDSRFRHSGSNRLPHDVVIVDETSMVSLSMMARLLEAVRSDARVVLVGDPEQLASVEAGAVLGDVVGPASRDSSGVGGPASAGRPGSAEGIAAGIVVLREGYRFGGGIAEVAEAVRSGDADQAIEILVRGGAGDLEWLPVDVAARGTPLGPLQEAAVGAGAAVLCAARAGDARAALDALGSFRLLCAHRLGPYGVATWMARVESWLAARVDGFATERSWYAGRPLLVTENDYGLRLYNGDTGVVVNTGTTSAPRLRAVFERRGELLEFSPTRLAAVDTVYAMTVHKSQGSQFGTVAVVLPDASSPILTRELLYTAITRARRRLILAATEDAIRAAITRPIARASGLRDLLGPGPR